MTESEALDAITRIFRDPQWGVGMLEDIAETVASTGRNLESPNEDSTCERH
jgi:hypothetical protein